MRVTLLQRYDAFYGHGGLPPRPIVLTFDDGYQSVYTTAYPILRRFGFVGTVFVITGYVGRGPRMLTWSELREMQDSGVMDVESVVPLCALRALYGGGRLCLRTSRDSTARHVRAVLFLARHAETDEGG